MERAQKRLSKAKDETETIEEAPVPEKNAQIEADKKYTDDLLDEIDEVLEENAEAFVANYIQGGGE